MMFPAWQIARYESSGTRAAFQISKGKDGPLPSRMVISCYVSPKCTTTTLIDPVDTIDRPPQGDEESLGCNKIQAALSNHQEDKGHV